MNLHEFLSKKKYLSIPLKRTRSNHFKLTAKINGVKGRFILDTGASNTCIGIDKADKFLIEPEETDTKASGAGALDIETMAASDVSIKIQKWRYDNLHLVLLDLSHVNAALELHLMKPVDGIIGADILDKGNAVIDYKYKVLYLKKNKYGFKFE